MGLQLITTNIIILGVVVVTPRLRTPTTTPPFPMAVTIFRFGPTTTAATTVVGPHLSGSISIPKPQVLPSLKITLPPIPSTPRLIGIGRLRTMALQVLGHPIATTSSVVGIPISTQIPLHIILLFLPVPTRSGSGLTTTPEMLAILRGWR